MACFLVPAAEAVVVTTAYFISRHQEKKKEIKQEFNGEKKEPLSKKLLSLDYLLLGGSALLAYEHLWHGEISPVFPFLTAASEGKEAMNEVLFEMSTVGVCMALLCTFAWGAVQLIKHFAKKKAKKVVENN